MRKSTSHGSFPTRKNKAKNRVSKEVGHGKKSKYRKLLTPASRWFDMLVTYLFWIVLHQQFHRQHPSFPTNDHSVPTGKAAKLPLHQAQNLWKPRNSHNHPCCGTLDNRYHTRNYGNYHLTFYLSSIPLYCKAKNPRNYKSRIATRFTKAKYHWNQRKQQRLDSPKFNPTKITKVK